MPGEAPTATVLPPPAVPAVEVQPPVLPATPDVTKATVAEGTKAPDAPGNKQPPQEKEPFEPIDDPKAARGLLEDLSGKNPDEAADRFDPAKLEAPDDLKRALGELQTELDKLKLALAETRDLSVDDIRAIRDSFDKSYDIFKKSGKGIDRETLLTINSHLRKEWQSFISNESIARTLQEIPRPGDPNANEPDVPDIAAEKGFSREAIRVYLKQLRPSVEPTEEDIDKAMAVVNKAFAPESRTRKWLKRGAVGLFVSLLLCQFVASMDQQGGGNH